MNIPGPFFPLQWHRRLYLPWLAGLPFLCLAGALSFWELPALKSQNRGLERQARTLETQLHAPIADAVSPSEQVSPAPLATFDRLTVVVNDMQALAASNGLTLSDATYEPVTDSADTGFGHMEISMRLKGGYVPLKKTIAALLAAHDGLALQEVSMRRSHSTDLMADIDLRFSFFYRRLT